MARPVIVIGLDAADPDLCARWMAAGALPNLADLRARGCYARLANADYFGSETSWTNFFTGVGPETSGHWNPMRYDPASYGIIDGGAYSYDEYPPFYALGEDFRVAAIDLPQSCLREDVNGIQVLAYGSHTAITARQSKPPDLLPRLIRSYGEHVAGQGQDRGRLWQKTSLKLLERRLVKGAARRGAICADIMAEGPWDLFLTIFSEFHSGGHLLLHYTDPSHPLHSAYKKPARDPLLEVAQAVDRALGRILEAAPEDATILVFSQEGMVANNIDAPTMLFVPELLYRYSFPGRCGITGGRPGDNAPPPPAITHPWSLNWARAIWSMKHDDNRLRRLIRHALPMELAHALEGLLGKAPGLGYPKDSKPFWYLPTLWYSRDWPRMKAFCLPTFSEACVRINLQGREPQGLVRPEDYESECQEITRLLLALKNPRNGRPIVRDVLRGRSGPEDRDPKKSPADLIVSYHDEPADVADSPDFGRIGPVPPCRSGSHSNQGLLIAAGPGIAAAATLPDARVLDLAPTILQRMGAPLPDYLEGKPLFSGDAGFGLNTDT